VLTKISKEKFLPYGRRKLNRTDLELFISASTIDMYLLNIVHSRMFLNVGNKLKPCFFRLCNSFVIKRKDNAKPFDEFKTTLFSNGTALTWIQYINTFLFGRNSTLLKPALIKMHNQSYYFFE